MLKFIHTADWHLGMQAHFLSDEARARFAQDRFDAVQRIADLAREEGCAFVVVAGDVFDSNHVDRQVVAKALDGLASFTVPVFLLPGNHDALDPSSIYRMPAWTDRKPANVVVLEDAVAIAVPELDGVEVIGSPWRSKRQLGDPVDLCHDVAPCTNNPTRIVIGHGIVDELSPDADDPSLISATAMRVALKNGKAAYIALGDRHSATEIAATDGRARYSGTPVATDHRELDPNEVLLVTLDDGACTVEPRTIGTWRFERPSRDLNSEEEVEALSQWLSAFPSKSTTVLKVALKGTLSLTASARLEEVLELNQLMFASLNRWERHTDLVIAPDEADLTVLDVTGYAREALGILSEQAAGSDDDALVAGDALNLLYRLAR